MNPFEDGLLAQQKETYGYTIFEHYMRMGTSHRPEDTTPIAIILYSNHLRNNPLFPGCNIRYTKQRSFIKENPNCINVFDEVMEAVNSVRQDDINLCLEYM